MSGIVRVVAPPPPGPPAPAPPGGNPPGGGPPTGPGAPAPTLPLLSVTLKVSDATPLAGKRVRVFGVVRPARDGRKVQIQKRLRNGASRRSPPPACVTPAPPSRPTACCCACPPTRCCAPAWPGDDEPATGLSHRRKLDVHSPA